MRNLDKQNLESMTPEELVDLSERTRTDIHWERCELYRKAWEKSNALGDVEKPKKMEMEVKAFCLYGRKYTEEERFCPLIGRFEGEFKDQFTGDDFMYYKARLTETQNPILKARYADVIWEVNHSEDKYAKQAIEEYLHCANLYFDSGDDVALEDSLARALSIALAIKQKIEVTVQGHLDFINKLINDTQRYRALTGVISSILDRSTKKKPLLDLRKLIPIIEKAIESYTLPGPGYSDDKIAFLDRLAQIFSLLGDVDMVEQTKIRIAQSYEEYGRVFAGPAGAFNRAHFLGKARDIYLNLHSRSEDVNRLELEIRETNLEGIQAMRPVTTQQVLKEVNPPDFEKYIMAQPKEIFELIANDTNLLPPYEVLKQIAYRNANPLPTLIQVTSMQGELSHKKAAGLKDGDDPDSNKNLEWQIIQFFYNPQLKIKTKWLSRIFDILKKKDERFIELGKYLESSKIIPEEKIVLIKHGLIAYANRDYVSTAYIILFQIEAVLRELLIKLGISPTSYNQRTGEESEKTLNSIINDLYGRSDVDQDLVHFMDIFLCNPFGYNYRDKVAHGLLGIEYFNEAYVLLLLLILLKIAPYPKGQT